MVLASASPRRKKLLLELFERYEVLPADIDEEALTVLDPVATAEGLARAKARKIFAIRPNSLVIGADTVVALESDSGWIQLSKPVDREDASRMISLLSGRTHEVITGFCLLSPEFEEVGSDRTRVTFRELSREEIAAYVDSGEGDDKAGAYGIQGMAGGLVQAYEGSLTNVVGLPLEALAKVLSAVFKK